MQEIRRDTARAVCHQNKDGKRRKQNCYAERAVMATETAVTGAGKRVAESALQAREGVKRPAGPKMEVGETKVRVEAHPMVMKGG